MNKVYSHENLALVHSAKNLLEISGIECFLKNEHYATGGHAGLASFPVELWVTNSDDSAKAATILAKDLSSNDQQSAWICVECGEENDGSFEICWNCQHEKRPN